MEIPTKKWLRTQQAQVLDNIDLASPPFECPTKAVRVVQKEIRRQVHTAPPKHDQESTRTSPNLLGGTSGSSRGSRTKSRCYQNSETDHNCGGGEQKFQHVLCKTRNGALSSILVPGDEPEKWESIYDQSQITDATTEPQPETFWTGTRNAVHRFPSLELGRVSRHRENV
jgi:hypothetical protein